MVGCHPGVGQCLHFPLFFRQRTDVGIIRRMIPVASHDIVRGRQNLMNTVEKWGRLLRNVWSLRRNAGNGPVIWEECLQVQHSRKNYRHYYILLLMTRALSCSFCRNRKTFIVLSTVHLDAFQPMKALPDNLLRSLFLTGQREEFHRGLGVAMFERQPQCLTISKGRMVFGTRKQAR
jgi:hypothetical protein